MIAEWLVTDLLTLVRERYPAWDGFAHEPFVADELTYKRTTAVKARQLLGRRAMEEILSTAVYDTLIERLEQVGRDNNLLWTAQPSRGDLAILYTPHLNKWDFAEQMRALLHGQRPTPDKLQTFADYCTAENLPNKWTFPTYFMFMLRPHADMFIKPSVAKWFLKFMGMSELYTAVPSADLYERYKKNCHGLLNSLASYGPKDMIDIQSFIWVAYQASLARTGGLDSRGQVDLEVPRSPSTHSAHPPTAKMREQAAAYQTDPQPIYPVTMMSEQTGYAVETIQQWRRALRRKQQVVFYGPPGTGKTFLAEQLARQWVSGSDGLVELVQFHPAYDYADFVEGLRPQTTAENQLSYEMLPGRLLEFCGRVAEREGNCVLIIDEINRANLSQVLGELFYLLEYRQATISLASGTRFSLPPNLYLIGTMNTADRSVALVDHALRRRFAFIWLPPNYDVLRHYHRQTDFDPEALIRVLQRLNNHIEDAHYAVGISYFLRPDLSRELGEIWQLEIEPYLEEYFFNQPAQIEPFRWAVVSPEAFG
jgi:MoxR-like ATPase